MRCSIPHSYESVLSQSVSSIRDNFDGGIVDLRCLACPPNYQLFLLTSVTLDDSSENKHNARLIIKIWRYFLSLFRLLLIITAWALCVMQFRSQFRFSFYLNFILVAGCSKI